MPRFETEPDPLFKEINDSLSFDLRLWPQDLRGSRAHAGALERAGVLSTEELERILEGLDRVADELERETFEAELGDEDVHMAIERRLTELIGPLGGKLHTGRSRNDQVATDVALYVADVAERDRGLVTQLMEVVLSRATEHADWPLPGYTHLQRAQPVYLGHHLLAWFWMLARDRDRLAGAGRRALMEMPLGSGALAGSNWELDRDGVARELGFQAPSANSLDAVSSRDAALDYLSAAAICSTHLSRIGAEIVIWSSQEFGFSEPDDAFASGSSLMPQKKNPDAAELLRAKAPRVAAAFQRLNGVLHALPLAYSKDLQEDKEALFEAADTIRLSLAVARRMIEGLSFDRERMESAAADELPAATDIADLLVSKGVAFREAHGIVGGIVRDALARGASLSDLTRDELARHTELLGDDFYATLERRGWIESKRSFGGTSSARLAEQLELARDALGRS